MRDKCSFFLLLREHGAIGVAAAGLASGTPMGTGRRPQIRRQLPHLDGCSKATNVFLCFTCQSRFVCFTCPVAIVSGELGAP